MVFPPIWGEKGRMQVILYSLFARQGSAPKWGGKKGEFRDWTRFGHDFLAGQFVSVRSFLIAETTRYSGFFLLSLVTCFANWQRFGFEFHLRSSSSAYSGFVNISRPAEYFTACYTVLKIPNKVETAFHGCNLAFSLVSIVSLPR